jgi:hypothetical protein
MTKIPVLVGINGYRFLYTGSELERAEKLQTADESLRGKTLYEIAEMLRAIPATAYEHPLHDSSMERSR